MFPFFLNIFIFTGPVSKTLFSRSTNSFFCRFFLKSFNGLTMNVTSIMQWKTTFFPIFVSCFYEILYRTVWWYGINWQSFDTRETENWIWLNVTMEPPRPLQPIFLNDRNLSSIVCWNSISLDLEEIKTKIIKVWLCLATFAVQFKDSWSNLVIH